ncbi:uncharacterized protein LOC143564355 [Bidens hawaiensis]|uniref:uncharacterized protein LOC143564355 n=1 Tax=Bidens hawaiensis TaxID=980011 RepID=UPI00404A3CB4
MVEDLGENGNSDDEVEIRPINEPKNSITKNLNESVKEKETPYAKETGPMGKTVPFPWALVNPATSSLIKRVPQQKEMWEVFKQVKINLLLIDAIKQVPTYAKYLKDLCTQNRTYKMPKQVDLTANVSSVLTGILPPKLQDPGTPIIPIQVGDFKMTRALLDLGVGVSILPGSLYDQYDFGPLRKADTTMVLADLTLKRPRGIVTDVICHDRGLLSPG